MPCQAGQLRVLFINAQTDWSKWVYRTTQPSRPGGVMSAQHGQRARFHRNRKRRVLQRMRVRAVVLALKDTKAKDGPALQASSK